MDAMADPRPTLDRLVSGMTDLRHDGWFGEPKADGAADPVLERDPK